jgi:hypothetical protein
MEAIRGEEFLCVEFFGYSDFGDSPLGVGLRGELLFLGGHGLLVLLAEAAHHVVAGYQT